jgi:ABC-type uncharacterized transport system permease subunit
MSVINLAPPVCLASAVTAAAVLPGDTAWALAFGVVAVVLIAAVCALLALKLVTDASARAQQFLITLVGVIFGAVNPRKSPTRRRRRRTGRPQR